jgi:taurine dioxygenase
MVVWDNRRTLHAAMGHPVDQIRIVHRTTIKGTIPMGKVMEEARA